MSPGVSEASRRRLAAHAGASASRTQRQPRGGKRGCGSDIIERLAFFSLDQHTCLPVKTSMPDAPRCSLTPRRQLTGTAAVGKQGKQGSLRYLSSI